MPASPPPGADSVQILDADAERQIAAYPWQTDRCLVAVYEPSKFPEGYLKSAWERTVEQDLLGWFYPGQDMSWERFRAVVAGRPILLGLVKPTLDLAGLAIVWDITGDGWFRKADFGFAFFKQYWGTRLVREIAHVMLRSVYSETGVDRLTGTTLADNLPARAFAKEMGFEELAVLKRWVPAPHGFSDAVVVAQDRESYEHGTTERTDIRQERRRRH